MVEASRRAPEGIEVQVDGGEHSHDGNGATAQVQRDLGSGFRVQLEEKEFVQRVKKSFFQGTGGCARPFSHISAPDVHAA